MIENETMIAAVAVFALVNVIWFTYALLSSWPKKYGYSLKEMISEG